MEAEEKNREGQLPFEKTPAKKFYISLRIKFALPITVLVLLMLCVLSFYFVMRETSILKEHFVAFADRELTYFQNTARYAISSGDERSLLFFMNHLENNLGYTLYAVVTKSDGTVTNGFDKRNELKPGSVFSDGIERNVYLQKEAREKIKIIIYESPDNKGRIYDFSAPVLTLSNKVVGFVIIGFSDSVISVEIAKTRRQLTAISLGFIILFAIGAFLLSSATVRPIKKLSEGIAIIGSGNLDYVIDMERSDELGMLADRFNLMTRQIREAKDREINNRVIQEQLGMARDIQEGLNPMAYYHKGGIQIKGFTRAAQDVGGDYFDYIDIDENRIGVLISDVSGKGLPASLVMVMIRTVFTTYIKHMDDIDSAAAVTTINDLLNSDFAIDEFATLFFFIYDRKKEELSFSNAGHGPLYCFRKKDGAITSTQLDGMPIGIMANARYFQGKARLEPGDIIIMFTDGAKEMRNIDKEEYGLDRILRMLVEKHDLPADDIVKALVDDIDDFRKNVPPHDDMTLVVFKRDA